MDLSKLETSLRARRRGTTNRDYTLPARRDTNAPDLEVNARVRGTNSSRADVIRQTLGLVSDAAVSTSQLFAVRDAKRQDEFAAQGALDASRGATDEAQLEKNRGYARGYYASKASRTVAQLGAEVSIGVEELLANDEDPADLQDVSDYLDAVFTNAALDEEGLPKDFGTSEAGLSFAEGLVDLRNRVIAAAAPIIKERTDTELIENVGFSIMNHVLRGDIKLPEQTLRAVPVPASKATGQGEPITETIQVGAPTGRLPVAGAQTSGYNVTRTTGRHKGLDIDGQIGDPIEAPAGGRVKTVGNTKLNGNYVVIDHGGGVESWYLHLDSVDVQEGQVVDSGAVFAKMGNTGRVSKKTGDGSHLHYEVRVNGERVDPTEFQFDTAGEFTGARASAPEPFEAAPETRPDAFNFEAYMSMIPLSIDRRKAKKELLSYFIQGAEEARNPRLLDALWQSRRADGTPSFSPDEINLIRDSRDRLVARVDREVEKARTDRYDENAERLYGAWVEQGAPPAESTIRDWVAQDRISARFGASLINMIETDERQARSMARAEDREAQREEDYNLDVLVQATIEERNSGVITEGNAADDEQLFISGQLGSGPKALARYKRLRTAARTAGNIAAQSPDAALYAQTLKNEFAPVSEGGSLVARSRAQASGGVDKATYMAMQKRYVQLVRGGTDPAEAYVKVKSEFKSSTETLDDKRARAAALKAKQNK